MIDCSKTESLPETPWITRFRESPQAKLRLFCFPYAGGSALIYRAWPDLMPSIVDICPVELPGRGRRLRETPSARLSPLVQAISEAIAPYLDMPFAFFGHSMGALVSFELAHKLREEHGLQPLHLFASGAGAPPMRTADRATYNLPEPEFIEEMRRLNGTPKQIFEHRELMQLLVPLLRADFEVCQTYKYSVKPPLDCPITVFGGAQDEEVTREHLEAWRDLTTAAFQLKMFPGDHFFINSSKVSLVQIISRALRELVTDPDRRI